MKNKPADIPYGGLKAERIQAAKPQFHKEHLEMFREFVIDRYRIHVLKDVKKQPAPWTDNPILREFKFTNVRREHDRTTKHLLALLEEHKDAPYNDKLMNIIMYRLYNKMETIDLIGWIDWGKFNEASIKAKLESAPKDFVYFTNAFYTTGMRQGMNRQYPDEEFKPINIPRVLNRDKRKRKLVSAIKAAKTPMDVMNAVKQLDGVGDFLGYQMFVDLNETRIDAGSHNRNIANQPLAQYLA